MNTIHLCGPCAVVVVNGDTSCMYCEADQDCERCERRDATLEGLGYLTPAGQTTSPVGVWDCFGCNEHCYGTQNVFETEAAV